MKSSTIFTFVTILAVAIVYAQSKRCSKNGGFCTKSVKKGCKKLPYNCKSQTAICCQKDKAASRGTKRVCKNPQKCKKEGGTCLRSEGSSTVPCPTVTVDGLCQGKKCTCCLGDSKKCGSSSGCSQSGGICMKKSKSKKYCKTGTIDNDSCAGNCVCCIPAPGETSGSGTTTGCKCGQANEDERIVGGEEVSPRNKYPWMVGLIVPYLSNGYGCGGTLINNRYVLTAGHCVYDPSTEEPIKAKLLQVGVGDHQQLTDKEDISGVTQRIKVASYVVHPDYDFGGLGDDIAIIKLKSPVDTSASEKVLPVCLPKDDSNSYKGYDGIVAGWGLQDYYDTFSYTDPLFEVTVPIWDAKCSGYKPSFDITKNMLCAGFKKGGKDACSGDSGGPLVVKEDGVYTIVGVVSFGEQCAQPKKPGVYTRVSKFLKWIAENTKDATYCS